MSGSDIGGVGGFGGPGGIPPAFVEERVGSELAVRVQKLEQEAQAPVLDLIEKTMGVGQNLDVEA